MLKQLDLCVGLRCVSIPVWQASEPIHALTSMLNGIEKSFNFCSCSDKANERDPHAPSPKEITKHEPNYVVKHKGEELSTAAIKASQLGPYQILRYPRADSTLPELLFPVMQSFCYGSARE